MTKLLNICNVSLFMSTFIFSHSSQNINSLNSDEQVSSKLFKSTNIWEETNIENKEGDYSRWSSKSEKILTATNVYTYSNQIGDLEYIYKNYKSVEITFDIKIGIYASSGGEYNFFDRTLKFTTFLKDVKGPESNILPDNEEKQQNSINITGNHWSGYGFIGKQTGTFVFEHSTGNYAKWAFINVGAFWSDSGNLIVRHNGKYSFKNASGSKKYINTYRKVKSIDFIPNY
ncbi:hypothetical protein [Spiroplasma endosymbiont of Diplazon laetatorius]|uniref:hypothetical protein n=1 Tax=Spiroplasma endosymbiont of Diplazon laetatorius TaxID=3066322 RepID=UPI0030CDC4BF